MKYHFRVTFLKSIVILKTLYIDWIRDIFTPIIHNISSYKKVLCTGHWLNNPHNLAKESSGRFKNQNRRKGTNTIRTFSGSYRIALGQIFLKLSDYKMSQVEMPKTIHCPRGTYGGEPEDGQHEFSGRKSNQFVLWVCVWPEVQLMTQKCPKTFGSRLWVISLI